MRQIPECINTPIFLKYVEHYYKRFRAQNGFGGRWLHEYQQMEKQGLFKPAVIRALYIKILNDTFTLGFIREQAIWYICVNAQDAAQAYLDNVESSSYKICVITGETAVDDDGDELIELTYDEAEQICKAMNEEAEEILFKVVKQ